MLHFGIEIEMLAMDGSLDLTNGLYRSPTEEEEEEERAGHEKLDSEGRHEESIRSDGPRLEKRGE
jgi:hypothetical protein